MVDKLSLNLENCYGIGKLKDELEFKHKGYAIYAPNGVMKTSFAKTMMDLSKGNKPSDLAFPERHSIYEVALNGEDLKKEEIFVVESYNEKYASNEVSTLLANAELRERYEGVHKDIGVAKNDLDKKLRSLSGYGEKSRENIEVIIEGVFGDSYYDALCHLEDELTDIEDAAFGDANYKIIYDPKVLKLLMDEGVGEAVEGFAQKYDELTDSSPILRKEFQYHNVNQVQKQLEANNFFNAGHSINLSDKNDNEKTEYTTNELFLEKIEVEKQRVLSDEELRKKFDKLNSVLKNKELEAFRDYITENQHLLIELRNLDAFKRKLWLQYIHKARKEYHLLIEKYKYGQKELASIVSEARDNPDDWDIVIQDFNRRFIHLPVRLSVGNKSDVILKGTAPSVEFNFVDGEDKRTYTEAEKNDLLRVLSTGEARALYILNIMFEVHTKLKLRKKTLFIFDDVADSFDYKNKFAIIDYIEDLVKVEDIEFLSIILTHNFDFLRTIESRNICPANQCRMAFKNRGEITLSDFKQSDIQNPFHKWQRRLSEEVIQVAYIPFLRNVIEYTQGKKYPDGNDNTDYLSLTHMLHYKDDTEQLKIEVYKQIFERIFPNLAFPEIDLNHGVLAHIFCTADQCLGVDDGINLEHKIVLSMAIRIWTERYIIGIIRSSDSNFEISSKQTGQLVQVFKDRFNHQTEKIALMKRINLITPSNIHINSFMYEPILDMGFGELKALYKDVKSKLV
jgi:hypothetical protein